MNAPQPIDTSPEQMRAMLDSQRKAFINEGHVSAETRIARLDKAISLIYDNQDALAEALAKDFTPISDFRASAEYRLQVSQGLLKRFYFDLNSSTEDLRVTHYA